MKFSISSFSSSANSPRRNSIRQKQFFSFCFDWDLEVWPPLPTPFFCTPCFAGLSGERKLDQHLRPIFFEQASLCFCELRIRQNWKKKFWLIYHLKKLSHRSSTRHFPSKLPPGTAPHSPLSWESFSGKRMMGKLGNSPPWLTKKTFSFLSLSDGKESHHTTVFTTSHCQSGTGESAKKAETVANLPRSRLAGKKVISRPEQKLANVSRQKDHQWDIDWTTLAFLLPGPKTFPFPAKGGWKEEKQMLIKLLHLSQMTSREPEKVFLGVGHQEDELPVISFPLPPPSKNAMMSSDPSLPIYRS